MRVIGIQVIVDDDDREQINKIMRTLREADKDLSLKYTTNSGAIQIRKEVDNSKNSSDEIKIKTKESLKKIVDTLLSIDKHTIFKPLWY